MGTSPAQTAAAPSQEIAPTALPDHHRPEPRIKGACKSHADALSLDFKSSIHLIIEF